MKKDNKRNGMIWAIVILALLNITTIATIIFNRNKTDNHDSTMEVKMTAKGDEPAAFSGRYFCDHLKFSNEQMSAFREVNPPFRSRVRKINNDLNRLRQTMLDEMSNRESDTILLSSLADSIGFFHSELKKETFRYYLSMKEICNEQQEETLKQIFGGMYSASLPQGRHGQGGGRGRHRGRQF